VQEAHQQVLELEVERASQDLADLQAGELGQLSAKVEGAELARTEQVEIHRAPMAQLKREPGAPCQVEARECASLSELLYRTLPASRQSLSVLLVFRHWNESQEMQ